MIEAREDKAPERIWLSPRVTDFPEISGWQIEDEIVSTYAMGAIEYRRADVTGPQQQPIDSAPKDGTPILVGVSYRYLPYKPDGRRQMRVPGRWQRATEYGWENAPTPECWFPSDPKRADPAAAVSDGVTDAMILAGQAEYQSYIGYAPSWKIIDAVLKAALSAAPKPTDLRSEAFDELLAAAKRLHELVVASSDKQGRVEFMGNADQVREAAEVISKAEACK